MRRIGTLWALTTVVVVGLATTSPATTAERRGNPDVTVLFDRALKKVRSQPKFAKAMFLEADGSTAGNEPVTTASGITKWRFQFQNGGGSKFLSVSIKFTASKGFGRPVGSTSPFLEDVVIRKAPKMTLDEAVALLDAAGYDGGFEGVALRNPLGPDSSAPLYIFALTNGDFVGVDTKTEQVEPLS